MLCINLLTVWITLYWVFRLSAAADICCCPDLKVSLKCEEKVQISKLMDNDYRCVVNNAQNVNLKCSLQDADHDAVKSVVYTFYRSSKFASSKVLSLDDSQAKEIISGAADVHEMESVKWAKANPTMDNSDNHFYQCVADVTLIDDLTFRLVSNSMFLDVMSLPVEPPAPTPKAVKVNTGFPTEEFDCVLPESNPPTIPKWSFDGVEIDIKSSTRGNRLAMIGGTLLVMNYNPTEDAGTYKCQGVYTNLLSGSPDTFDISEYTVSSTDNQNNGAAVVEVVSNIVTPILIDQDSPVSFTTYFKDSAATVLGDPKEELEYTWKYYNEQKLGGAMWEILSNDNAKTKEFMKYVTIENSDRTLVVNNVNALFAGEDNESTRFKCEGERGGVKKDGQIFGNFDQPVQFFLPEEFDIPTSDSCIDKDDPITTTVNQEYMKKKTYDPTNLQKQYLIESTNTFLFNGDALTMLSNANGATLTEDVGMSFPADKFAEQHSDFQNGRCLYFQYMNSFYNEQVTAGYQILETSKVETGCTDIPRSEICNKASAVCTEDTSITVTLKSDTTQCLSLSAQLEKSGTVVSKTPKSFTKVAGSEQEMTEIFTETDLVPGTTLTGDFNFKTYSCGKTEICTIPVSCDSSSGSSIVIIVVVVVVIALILILWGLIAVLQYKGCCCTAVPVYPACCCGSKSSEVKETPCTVLSIQTDVTTPSQTPVVYSLTNGEDGTVALNTKDEEKPKLYEKEYQAVKKSDAGKPDTKPDMTDITNAKNSASGENFAVDDGIQDLEHVHDEDPYRDAVDSTL